MFSTRDSQPTVLKLQLQSLQNNVNHESTEKKETKADKYVQFSLFFSFYLWKQTVLKYFKTVVQANQSASPEDEGRLCRPPRRRVRAAPDSSHLLRPPRTGPSKDPRGAQKITTGLEERPQTSRGARLSQFNFCFHSRTV